MSASSNLICLGCGASNSEGESCNRCGKSLRISAADLPTLLIRRLVGVGFTEPASITSDPETLTRLEGLFQDAAHLGSECILVFPPRISQSHPIHTLYVASVGKGDGEIAKGLSSGTKGILARMTALLKSLKQPRIVSVRIRRYIVYSEALSAEHLHAHCVPRRERIARARRNRLSFGSRIDVNVVPMDTVGGKVHFASRYIEPDRQAIAAMRQLQEVGKPKPARHFFREYARLVVTIPLEGLGTYVERLRLAEQPDVLAHQITSGALHAKELLGTIAVSAAAAGLLAQVLNVDLGGVTTGVSLLDKTLDGLVLMLAFLFSAAVTHVPLRLAGGRATFRSTFVATTFISAVAYPAIVAMVGALMILGTPEDDAWKASQAVPVVLSAWILGALHAISWKRAFIVLAVALPVAVLAVLLIVLLVFRLVGVVAGSL